MSSRFKASATTPNARTPFAVSSLTIASTRSFVREQTATFTPSSARPNAIARPMPCVPPVTNANFPLRPKSIMLLHHGPPYYERESLHKKASEIRSLHFQDFHLFFRFKRLKAREIPLRIAAFFVKLC